MLDPGIHHVSTYVYQKTLTNLPVSLIISTFGGIFSILIASASICSGSSKSSGEALAFTPGNLQNKPHPNHAYLNKHSKLMFLLQNTAAYCKPTNFRGH
jgi:hypothetical protein